MKVGTTILSIFLFGCNLIGQSGIDVRVERVDPGEEFFTCFNLEVRNSEMPPLKLASMNYRLFYNSDNLSFRADDIRLFLPSEYTLKLVQNLKDVDASGTGPLPFEQDLGFLNFSVIYQDGSPGSIRMVQGEPWLAVVQLCFDVADEQNHQTIVLARDEVTARYGKAYVELSAYDENDQIMAARISSYGDYNFVVSKRSN